MTGYFPLNSLVLFPRKGMPLKQATLQTGRSQKALVEGSRSRRGLPHGAQVITKREEHSRVCAGQGSGASNSGSRTRPK